MDIEAYCNNIVEVVEASPDQIDAIHALLETKGFLAFLGLLLATKSAQHHILTNTSLATETGRYSAAVTQGTIKGLDIPRATLLELFHKPRDPSTAGVE